MKEKLIKISIFLILFIVTPVFAKTIDSGLIDISEREFLELNGIKLNLESMLANVDENLFVYIDTINTTNQDLKYEIDVMFFNNVEEFITGSKTKILDIKSNDYGLDLLIIPHKGVELPNIKYIKTQLTIHSLYEEEIIPSSNQEQGYSIDQYHYEMRQSLRVEDLKIFFFLVPLITLALTVTLYLKFNRGRKVSKIFSQRPPQDLSAFDFKSYYFNFIIDKKVLLAYLIPLARKGFLTIDTSNDSLIITKIKDYDGDDLIEEQFLKEFFHATDTLDFSFELLGENSLEYSKIEKTIFWTKLSLIATKISKEQKKSPEYQRLIKPMPKKHSIFFLIVYIIGFILYLINFHDIDLYNLFAKNIEIPRIIFLIFIFFLSTMLMGYFFTIKKGYKKKNLLILICGLSFALASGFIVDSETKGLIFNIVFNYYYLFMYTVIMIIALNIKGLTEEGSNKMSLILGFEEYIRGVSGEELVSILKEDPNFIFDVYPYLIAFEIEYDIEEKVKGILIEKPEWYFNNKEDCSLKEILIDLNSMLEFLTNYKFN